MRTAFALQAAGVAAVALALSLRRIGDFDLPWHLAFARAIVTTGSIPRVDDFAYTHRPIQYAEFLGDLFLYGAERMGGILGLQVVGGLAGAATAVLLLTAVHRNGPLAPITVAVALATMNSWLIVRPAILSFILLAALVLVIETHRRQPSTKRSKLLLVLAAFMHLLWVNVHGFAVVGVVIALAYAGYRITARLGSRWLPALLPAEDGRDAVFCAATAIATVGLSLLNLAGPRLFLGPVRASNDFGTVTEWATTTPAFLLSTQPGALLLGALLIAALVLGRDPATKRRLPTLFDLFLIASATALGASAVRLLPLSAILLTPVISRRLSLLVPATGVTRIAGSAALLLAATTMLLLPGSSLGVGLERSHFPEGAVQFIRTTSPQGRMWNFFPFGGYLIWRLYPEHRVLVDGRSGWVHDPELMRRARESDSDPVALEALVSELDIQWAIVRASEGESLGAAFASSRAWQMVYWDDASAIYVLRSGLNVAMGKNGYLGFNHLIAPGQILEMAMKGGRVAPALAHDGTLAARQAPDSPRAVFLEACGAVALRDEDRYRASTARLAALSPGHPALGALEGAWGEVAEEAR